MVNCRLEERMDRMLSCKLKHNSAVHIYLPSFDRVETWVGLEQAPHTKGAIDWQNQLRMQEEQQYNNWLQQCEKRIPQSGRIESVPFFFEILSGGTSTVAKQATKLVAKKAVARGGISLKSTVGAARMGFSKLPKGFKLTRQFGYPHGQKVYKYRGKFYSRDVDAHNGGVWKVFENEGGRLKRIGTADEFLNIFKK